MDMCAPSFAIAVVSMVYLLHRHPKVFKGLATGIAKWWLEDNKDDAV